MASERIEKLLAMQQKAEAQKRKAEQQLKAAKQPLPVRGAHLYASSMRRAFSEGPCGGARCLRHQQGQAPAPIASATP